MITIVAGTAAIVALASAALGLLIADALRPPCDFETPPEFDARSIFQIDVEDDTSRNFKIGVMFKGLCR